MFSATIAKGMVTKKTDVEISKEASKAVMNRATMLKMSKEKKANSSKVKLNVWLRVRVEIKVSS